MRERERDVPRERKIITVVAGDGKSDAGIRDLRFWYGWHVNRATL